MSDKSAGSQAALIEFLASARESGLYNGLARQKLDEALAVIRRNVELERELADCRAELEAIKSIQIWNPEVDHPQTFRLHGRDWTIIAGKAEEPSRPAQGSRDAERKWLDSNTTFYDVQPDGPESCTAGPNIPVLAAVSKRIWYHATDDQSSYPFSAVLDAAMSQQEGK